MLPPPACTAPTELLAVLSPVPAIDVGAETADKNVIVVKEGDRLIAISVHVARQTVQYLVSTADGSVRVPFDEEHSWRFDHGRTGRLWKVRVGSRH